MADKKITTRNSLSTGASLLNLICTGKTTCGIPEGTIVHLCGDSDSGKTMEALTLFAEANRSKTFSDYRFKFWNPEDGSLMDKAEYFGKGVASRIEETQPETLEAFYHEVDDINESGDKFIGVLDSMDVLYPKAWAKKLKAAKNAAKKGEEESGDYGMQKAKLNSEHLRKVRSRLRKTGSILIILSQTRDNPNARFGDKRVVAGGRVLKFYSTLQIWTSTRETLTKRVHGKDRAIGIVAKFDVKKNHVNGQKGSCLVPILNDYGIDDVGACVDYLVEEKHWKTTSKREKKDDEKSKGKIVAPEFSDDAMPRDKLIRFIEERDEEKELRDLVKAVYREIQEGCKSERKKRYE